MLQKYLQNRSVRSLQECLHSACSAPSPPIPPSASLFQASPTDQSLSAIRLQRRCLALLAEPWASSVPWRAKDGRQTVTSVTSKEDLIRGRLGSRTWQQHLTPLLPVVCKMLSMARPQKCNHLSLSTRDLTSFVDNLWTITERSVTCPGAKRKENPYTERKITCIINLLLIIFEADSPPKHDCKLKQLAVSSSSRSSRPPV